jgi:hypothetical protein
LSAILAQASAILARSADAGASAWTLFARRTHRCEVARSPSVSFSSAFGRPVLAMHQLWPDIRLPAGMTRIHGHTLIYFYDEFKVRHTGVLSYKFTKLSRRS